MCVSLSTPLSLSTLRHSKKPTPPFLTKKVSLWTRNVQLGLYSVVIGLSAWSAEVQALATAAAAAGAAAAPPLAFFHGYTPLTFFNVAVQVRARG